MFYFNLFVDELRLVHPLSLDTALLLAAIEREHSSSCVGVKPPYEKDCLNKPRFNRHVAESKLRKG